MGVASNNSVNSGEAQTERWAILSQDYMVSSCGYIVSTFQELPVVRCNDYPERE